LPVNKYVAPPFLDSISSPLEVKFSVGGAKGYFTIEPFPRTGAVFYPQIYGDAAR
jgi:hypothetical protein